MGTNPGDGANESTERSDAADSGHSQEGREAGSTSRAGNQGKRVHTQFVEWATETFLRTGIAILGIVLFIFALGQIAGFDTIGAFADLLANEIVQWSLVAVFALLLILLATKSWDITPSN